MGTIRLACLFCDCDEFDGVDRVPANWRDVDEVQAYEDAMTEAGLIDQESTVWWTHLGVCPACQETRYRPANCDSASA